MTSLSAITAFVTAALALAGPSDLDADLIHSDLPLFQHSEATLWPRHIGGGVIGCESRVRFGDWRLDYAATPLGSVWYRFTNYGVFHCGMMVREGYRQSDLAGLDADPSFMVELGTGVGRDGSVELWALQQGTIPGSTYLLLARKPKSAQGAVDQFEVLQRRCPQERIREGPELDNWRVRYCGINSREELIQLARRMAAGSAGPIDADRRGASRARMIG